MIESETQNQALSERLAVLCDRCAIVATSIEDLENQLKKAKAEYVRLTEFEIPELLSEHGLTSAETLNGTKVQVTDAVHARISEAKNSEAMAWLRNNGAAGIIKHVVSVRIDPEQAEYAQAMAEKLRNDGLLVEESEGVHHSTLRSWAKEMIDSGVDVPTDLFGIYIQRKAKIS
jgi:hypothetical protein